jgi:hypothetical protein
MSFTNKLRNVDREPRSRFIYLLKRIFGLSGRCQLLASIDWTG